MKNIFIILISFLFLVACGGDATQADGAAKTGDADKAAASAPVEVTPVTLKYEGLGTLTGETVLSKEAVEAALPGLVIRDNMDSKGKISTTQAFKKSNGQFVEVMTFYPDPETGNLSQIVIRDTEMLEGFGAEMGQTHAEVTAGGTSLSCVPGTDPYQGKILCRSTETKTIMYVFSLSDWKGSKKKLPGDEVLAGATLGQVIWQAN